VGAEELGGRGGRGVGDRFGLGGVKRECRALALCGCPVSVLDRGATRDGGGTSGSGRGGDGGRALAVWRLCFR